MPESRIEKVGARLAEEARRLLSYPEIEQLSAERGYPTSVRTLRFYVNEQVLPQPLKRGNAPVFPETEILALLFAIHLMKSRFGRSLEQVRRVMRLLQGDPGVLAEKMALLYEETHDERRHRVERDWLVETFFAALEGTCTDYPHARAGEPGPRSVDEVHVTELVEDLDQRSRWERGPDGTPHWISPTRSAPAAGSRVPRSGGVPMNERGSEVERSAEVTPLRLPDGAIEVDEARRREELFLRRFEQNLGKLERVYSPLEKKSYNLRPGMLDPQVEDPYQKVVDLLKEKGLYDRALLERLPHDRSTRFTLPPPGLFGRKAPKLVVAGVSVSPIEQLATLGGALRPLEEPDLARVIREHVRQRPAYHVLGIFSTVGWEPSVFRSPPRHENLSVVLVEIDAHGGWRTSHSLPKELGALALAFDPETLEEKVRRVFYRVIEHPELKIPGGHVEVESFLEEIALPRDVLDLAMKQVTHEDSRVKIVTIAERELLKRDRF